MLPTGPHRSILSDYAKPRRVRFATVNRKGDMTPMKMVLGVACEEPGTVAEIQSRLTDLFVSAGFAANAAHTSLPALAERGHLRVVHDEPEDRYESTPAGVEELRRWVRCKPPLALRESVHGRVEFATLDELADVIIAVWAEAKEAQINSDECQMRMLYVQRRRTLLRRGKGKSTADDLDAELSAIRTADVRLMWEDMANRRRKLALRLEELYSRYAGDSE
jgi:DNA-binding PadR family transcriptional regulator